MPAGHLDLYIEQGTTWEHPLTWRETGGDPYDMTGWTARMQIRQTVDSAVPLADLTTENDGIELDADNAPNIILHMTATESAALDEDSFTPITEGENAGKFLAVYDLELQDPVGEVTRLLKGTVTLDPEVTR